MSRQLEQLNEERSRRRQLDIVAAVEYELERAVGHSGAELTGLSVRFGAGECLITVRGYLGGRAQIAFVGAEDLGGALIKVVRLAKVDKLVWKDDSYANR